MSNKKVPSSFEEALKELEEIVRELEEGADLERSLQLVERGRFLIQYCEKKLEEAKGKWFLLQKEEEEVKIQEFSPQEFPEDLGKHAF